MNEGPFEDHQTPASLPGFSFHGKKAEPENQIPWAIDFNARPLTHIATRVTFRIQSGCHFLLVEDDENDAVLFERTLSKVAGSSTLHHCSDTEAAKRYLLGEEHFSDRKQYPLPQAIFCDLRVGLDSGLDFLKWLRTHALLTLPLIIFSGDLSDRELTQVYDAGANSVVIKPASLAEFEQKIKAITAFWSLAQKPSPVQSHR